MRILNFKKGSSVVVQNSVNRGYFYLVRKGTLSVDTEHKFNDKALSRFEKGDTFGLVSALTGQKYLVSVFAAEDSEVAEIPVSNLGTYLKEHREIAIKMMGQYTNELRTIHKYLTRVNKPEERFFHPEKLVADAVRYLGIGNPTCAAYALSKFLEWAENDHSAEKIEKLKNTAELLLKENKLTRSLPQWENNTKKVPPGEILFLENEISNEIYIIKSGAVKLFTLAQNQELVITVLGEGEIFGEMAFIDQSTRMASAMAVTESELIRFSKDNLFEKVGEVLLQKMFENLARRIWFSHQRLVILRIKEPVSRVYAFLYNLIRDHDIRTRNPDSTEESYTFSMNFEDLKKMAGMGNLNDKKVETVLTDPNIVWGKTEIQIRNKKRIEEKVAFYRSQAGQITTGNL